MSESNHHDHGHDHGPGCGCGHDHGHEPAQDRPKPAPAPAPEPPVTPLDPGSRALEEALRSSFTVVKILMIILALIAILSGVKTVAPQERAVILRFGKPIGGQTTEQLLGPGLHWAFPYPIDEMIPIQVGQIQTVTSTVGWYGTSQEMEFLGGQAPRVASLPPELHGYALTGDGNIVHARATLRFRITDPLAYRFGFVNASNAVVAILNNALMHAAAHSTVDDALLNNAAFKEKVVARVNQQVDALQLGITVEPSDVTVVQPGYVKPDFDAVLEAEQGRSTMILAAQGYAQTTVPGAEAEANSLVNAAEEERIRLVRAVAADALSFSSQLPQYEADPRLFEQRLLAETWQRILARASSKFITIDSGRDNPRELRLLLNREPPKPKTQSPAAP